MSLNARSIVNKLDLFHATVIEMKPDIVGVTETWATDNILDSELDLEGTRNFAVIDRRVIEVVEY